MTYTDVFAAIGANEFASTVAFYRTLLGREPDERIGDGYVAFRLPGLHLGIFAPREANRPHFANAGLCGGLSLVMRVPDVDAARAELEALNAAKPPGDVQATRHGREFYAYDPEGNRVIVVEGA